MAEDKQRKPRVAILYHYMYPDDVVSAQHFDDLAISLASRGWRVSAYPCNRGCRDESKRYEARSDYRDVTYHRIWRPATSQRKTVGRLFNTLWMIIAWARIAFQSRHEKPDVVVVGTDPVFAVLVAIPMKFFSPNIKIAHWCFDLHPEAAVVTGLKDESSLSVKIVKKLLSKAYKRCDLIVDLGSCMRGRLREYAHNATEVEIPPWALVEPKQPFDCDETIRHRYYGNAKLGVLYSGNYGEAHSLDTIVSLARSLRGHSSVHFCFSVRGSKEQQLKNAIDENDTNISFSEFVPLDQLDAHLGAADIHLACLKQEWTGVAVPSKFLGSLAAGRPVLFSGAEQSCISTWITQSKIGWLLNESNIEAVAAELLRLAESEDEVRRLQLHCHSIYTLKFSRDAMTLRWHEQLIRLLPAAFPNPMTNH